mgnify:FL=1
MHGTLLLMTAYARGQGFGSLRRVLRTQPTAIQTISSTVPSASRRSGS